MLTKLTGVRVVPGRTGPLPDLNRVSPPSFFSIGCRTGLAPVYSVPLLFSFLVSVIYSKAKLASACGGIIYFLSYVPYMYVAIREEVAHDKITAFEKCIAVRPHSSSRLRFPWRYHGN